MEERTLIQRLARHLAGETPEAWPEKVDAAASILALGDEALGERLKAWRARQTEAVAERPQD